MALAPLLHLLLDRRPLRLAERGAALQHVAAPVVGRAVALAPLLYLLLDYQPLRHSKQRAALQRAAAPGGRTRGGVLDRRPPRRSERSGALQRAAAAVVGRAVALAPLRHLLLNHRPLRLQKVQRLARRVLRLVREQVRARPAAPAPPARSAPEQSLLLYIIPVHVCCLQAGGGAHKLACLAVNQAHERGEPVALRPLQR